VAAIAKDLQALGADGQAAFKDIGIESNNLILNIEAATGYIDTFKLSIRQTKDEVESLNQSFEDTKRKTSEALEDLRGMSAAQEVQRKITDDETEEKRTVDRLTARRTELETMRDTLTYMMPGDYVAAHFQATGELLKTGDLHSSILGRTGLIKGDVEGLNRQIFGVDDQIHQSRGLADRRQKSIRDDYSEAMVQDERVKAQLAGRLGNLIEEVVTTTLISQGQAEGFGPDSNEWKLRKARMTQEYEEEKKQKDKELSTEEQALRGQVSDRTLTDDQRIKAANDLEQARAVGATPIEVAGLKMELQTQIDSINRERKEADKQNADRLRTLEESALRSQVSDRSLPDDVRVGAANTLEQMREAGQPAAGIAALQVELKGMLDEIARTSQAHKEAAAETKATMKQVGEALKLQAEVSKQLQREAQEAARKLEDVSRRLDNSRGTR